MLGWLQMQQETKPKLDREDHHVPVTEKEIFMYDVVPLPGRFWDMPKNLDKSGQQSQTEKERGSYKER
jgi:hypothetical protein